MTTSATCKIVAIALLTLVGCTQPKQTTAVGAAAGGAIGAGLGAIIGNQTGNAGGGVAIGAVAGAATGALVANALQAQQESTRSQDEAIERQQRLLQAQRSEISELRKLNTDEVDKKRIALQKRGPLPLQYRTAAMKQSDSLNSLAASDVKARYNAESSAPVKTSSATKAPATKKAAAPAAKSEPAPLPTTKKAPLLPDLTDNTDESSTTTSRVTQTTDMASCKDAAKEQRAATEATDTSDKLFHLRKALRLCPENAELHFELGKVYSSMSRASDAKQEFEEALKIDPTFSAAQSELSTLKEPASDRF